MTPVSGGAPVAASGSATQSPIAADIVASESLKNFQERQIEPAGSSVVDPLVSDAGLEYVPVRYSGGLEIFAGQRVAMSFTVPADGAITAVELVSLGHQDCRADAALDFRLMATVEGYPGTPVFYFVSIPPEDVDLEQSNFRIDLPEAWPVGAYQTLALELSTNDDPTTGDNCYYAWDGESPGSYRGGQAFSSRDGGRTWLPDRKDLAFRIFFQPDSPAAIPAVTLSALVRRDLLSQPWRQGRLGDEPGQPWNERITLLTISTDHSIMYALNTKGCIENCRFYRSSDQGEIWWSVGLPFGWSAPLSLSAVDAREIYAWSDSMMWRSIDGGNQWTQLDTPTGIANPRVPPYIRAFAVSPETLYMATADQNYENGGLFQSSDKGVTWRHINRWVPGITRLSVAGDPATMHLTWRTGNSEGSQWSSDGGRSWDRPRDQATGDIANWRINDFTTGFVESGNLYVAVEGQGLLRISDLDPPESSVVWASDTAETGVQSVASHPNDAGVLAIRTAEGLFVTSDGGTSWAPLHHAGYQISNVLYQGLPDGVTGPIITTGSPWTICIGSVNGVWCHRGA